MSKRGWEKVLVAGSRETSQSGSCRKTRSIHVPAKGRKLAETPSGRTEGGGPEEQVPGHRCQALDRASQENLNDYASKQAGAHVQRHSDAIRLPQPRRRSYLDTPPELWC